MKSLCRLAAKIKIPYLPLQNLDERARKQVNYIPPSEYTDQYKKLASKMGLLDPLV